MKKKYYRWSVPLLGAALFSAAASDESTAPTAQDKYIYENSTNRLTLSLRFGLDIKSRFKGIGGSFQPGSAAGNGRRTPDGDLYNYDNGYVLPDYAASQNGGVEPLSLTTYWGYDNSANVSAGGQYDQANDRINFDRMTASGIPDEASGGDKPYPGLELSYDRELMRKENWHDLRLGVEAALNYMKISVSENNSYDATLTDVTTTYQLPGTTPPPASPGTPFQGTFNGSPGGYSLIGSAPIGSATTITPGAKFLTRDNFDADMLGGRLGPYAELPLTKNFDLRFSAGLAIGLLYGKGSWQETLTLPGGGGSMSSSGSGDAFQTLWGGYGSIEGSWQISKRWGVDGAVQYQDLGKFNNNFDGRQIELDLNRSLFFEAGVSYSF